jgi:hypothetical protein
MLMIFPNILNRSILDNCIYIIALLQAYYLHLYGYRNKTQIVLINLNNIIPFSLI